MQKRARRDEADSVAAFCLGDCACVGSAHLEQNLSSIDVAYASYSCLIHQDPSDRFLADLHSLP